MQQQHTYQKQNINKQKHVKLDSFYTLSSLLPQKFGYRPPLLHFRGGTPARENTLETIRLTYIQWYKQCFVS
jgi:hypothetical protein